MYFYNIGGGFYGCIWYLYQIKTCYLDWPNRPITFRGMMWFLTDPIHMGLKHKLRVILGFRMTPVNLNSIAIYFPKGMYLHTLLNNVVVKRDLYVSLVVIMLFIIIWSFRKNSYFYFSQKKYRSLWKLFNNTFFH